MEGVARGGGLLAGESERYDAPMRHREPAICLRTTDYSETSQVVHFLTRGVGVVRLLAKGVKRPKSKSGGPVDLLAEGDLVFTTTGRESLGTLFEFSETVSRAALRRSAVRLNAALYAIELTGIVQAEEDPAPEVFDLLRATLRRLGEPDAPVPAVVAYFQWRLLRHAGLLGDLDHCVGCEKPIATVRRGEVWFSARLGGLLCRCCQGSAPDKFRVSAETLAGLAALQEAGRGGPRREPLPDAQAHGVNRLLVSHVTEQFGRCPRMARHVIPPRAGRKR